MRPFGLPKTALLRKPAEYRRVYTGGRRVRGHNISLVYLANDRGYCRAGISVHGVRKAVLRNRIKRLAREYFRRHRHQLAAALAGAPDQGVDVVFAIRRDFPYLDQAAFDQAMTRLLRRLSPPAGPAAGKGR